MAQTYFDVPQPIQLDLTSYFAHILTGMPIREIARKTRCHPSTVLRRVRRLENRRDDRLLDAALERVEQAIGPRISQLKQKGQFMKFDASLQDVQPLGAQSDELKRVLRRLCETDAVLVVSPEMPKGVIMREVAQADPIRTAVVDRELAMSLALKDWIQVKKQGRVTRYCVTQAGRQALKRILAEAESSEDGFAEQHRTWGHRDVMSEKTQEARPVRVNLAESPLTLLARRKDKSGDRFLSDDLVTAGERLREDFELAQMAPSVTQNWDRFLTGPGTGGTLSDGKGGGSSAARARLQAALAELGPGLGDVALRCCCYLEGLETIEKRLGWAARSGKIVLRIALQRLKRHYDDLHGPGGPMIG